jgi:hypothetical protein
VTSALITVIVDLIDVITVTTGPIVAMTTGIDMIIAAMIGATTTVAMTAMTGVTTTRVIVVMTSAVTTEMISAMINVTRMTTTATTVIARSDLHHHYLKGATLMVHSNPSTERSTSSSAVAKRPKTTCSSGQTQGRFDMSTLKLRNLCVGRNSQSISP